MYLWQINTANTQLQQVSANYSIVLQQINTIPYARTDEIGRLREAVRALMNSTEMLSAVCSTLLSDAKVDK
jgi:hypothetical protein